EDVAPVEGAVAGRERGRRRVALAAEDVRMEVHGVRAVVVRETLAAEQHRLRRILAVVVGEALAAEQDGLGGRIRRRRDARDAAATAAVEQDDRGGEGDEREGGTENHSDEGKTLHGFFLSPLDRPARSTNHPTSAALQNGFSALARGERAFR